MSRIGDAFSSFFSILFSGSLPESVARNYGYMKPADKPAAKPEPPKPAFGPRDGALQILALLQRDARLLDFLLEDISGYDDAQVGAAVRQVHEESRAALGRYVKIEPVIDGVENTFTKTEGLDAKSYKLVGNVPASGKAPGGTLLHRGWRAASVNLPEPLPGGEILAPAELQVD